MGKIDEPAMKKTSGFTLVELMITLIVAGVILAIGVPSFTTAIRNNRIAAMSNQLVSALSLARSEAVKRAETVTFCRSTNGADCAGASTDWQPGWVIRDAGGNVLRSWGALSGNAALTGPAAPVQYLPTGFVNTAATFQLRTDDCTGNEGRDISISVTGRPSVAHASCS